MISEDEEDVYVRDKKVEGQLSQYAIFHLQNIGYEWIERATGKIFDKATIYCKFCREKEILKSLTRNCQINYDRVKKKDYICSQECINEVKSVLKGGDIY